MPIPCITTVVVFVALLVGLISSHYDGDDGPIEEISEEIIESQTGIDVDLTPNTKE